MRLDVLVTRSGLAESRERAQALILAGKVRVGGETVRKPDRSVSEYAALSVDAAPEYASRGALKLAPALDAFRVDPSKRVCADIGASTGGFTDVLLRRGAARVYAIDVGRGLLARRRYAGRDRRRSGARWCEVCVTLSRIPTAPKTVIPAKAGRWSHV